MTPTDHWNATGKSALDEQARREFDGSRLFWQVESFDRGLSIEALEEATDRQLDHAENTLHHWIEMIRSEQRKRKDHRSGRSG